VLPREWQERYELVVAVFQVPAWSAALEPVEAVEDEVERERELGVLIAWSGGATMGDRKGHIHHIGMGGAELALESGGRTFIPNSIGSTGRLSRAFPGARAVLMGLGSGLGPDPSAWHVIPAG
jgi:hypothetical protein